MRQFKEAELDLILLGSDIITTSDDPDNDVDSGL